MFVNLGGLEAQLNFCINDNGANLFHLATFRGSIPMVKILLGCRHLDLQAKNS